MVDFQENIFSDSKGHLIDSVFTRGKCANLVECVDRWIVGGRMLSLGKEVQKMHTALLELGIKTVMKTVE